MKFLTFLATLLLGTAVLQAQEPALAEWKNPAAIAKLAVASSPAIAELDARIAAARERRLPAGSQPNPMLMAGIRDLQVDLSKDEMMTMYMAGVEQTITRPSKLSARRQVVDLDVEALERQRKSLEAEAARAAHFAWLDIATADAQIATIEEVRELVGAITDASRVRYEVGNAVQAEVLRAQLERSNLEHQLLSLRGARRIAIARLLPLLALPADTEVPKLALPAATKQPLAVAAVAADHPALAALSVDIARREAQAKLAALDLRPDVSVEASYGYRPMQKDTFSVTAKVELPWRKKQLIEPRIREALALADATRSQIEQARRSIASGLAAAASTQQETAEQLRFHDEVLVPQSRMAFDSTLTSFQTGRTSFDSVLGSETTYLRLQLDAIGYLSRNVKAVVDYEALLRGARSGAAAGTSAPTASSPQSQSSDSTSSMTTM